MILCMTKIHFSIYLKNKMWLCCICVEYIPHHWLDHRYGCVKFELNLYKSLLTKYDSGLRWSVIKRLVQKLFQKGLLLNIYIDISKLFVYISNTVVELFFFQKQIV